MDGLRFTILNETPCAEPHAGCCGGWRLDTSGYPIIRHYSMSPWSELSSSFLAFHILSWDALFCQKRSLSRYSMNKINSPPTTGTKKTTTYTKNLLFGFMLFELRMANNEKARRNIQKTRKLSCRVVISMSYNNLMYRKNPLCKVETIRISLMSVLKLLS
mgnify:CR=1 FL=1